MLRFPRVFSLVAAAGLTAGLVLLIGCNASTPKPEAKAAASAQSPSRPAEPAKTGAAESLPKADPKGLKDLSPADRSLAEKQRVCPVTGEPLGSMGAPVKVTVKGRTVFLCCEGCEGEIKKDPDKYLAKLDNNGK